MSEGKSKYIGALWLKEGKNGKFMSGEIEIDGEKTSILVFKNTYKEKPNQPDYKILPASDNRRRETRQSDDFEDDVPF